jgi:ADP-dependent phosphofructokinase/glucokinase
MRESSETVSLLSEKERSRIFLELSKLQGREARKEIIDAEAKIQN